MYINHFFSIIKNWSNLYLIKVIRWLITFKMIVAYDVIKSTMNATKTNIAIQIQNWGQSSDYKLIRDIHGMQV